MYSRILVAVDDSDTSKLALDEALKLAKDQKAKLRIIYVVDEFISSGEGVYVDFKEHESSMRKSAKKILKEMVKLAKQAHNKIEHKLVEISEAEHLISEVIITEADKWEAELIILGTHGRSGLSRLLLGSVAEEVVRSTSIPVHIIRNPD